MVEPRDLLRVLGGVTDAVGRDAPNAFARGAGLGLARHELGNASAVVGEGIDPRQAFRDERLLQPDARLPLHHEDLGERVAMAIDATAAEAELHLGTRGEPVKRLLGLLHQRPGMVARPAKRRRRRLGADQPHDRAIGKLKRLAVIDPRHRAHLRLRQLACGGGRARACPRFGIAARRQHQRGDYRQGCADHGGV